ncbi:MAG: hypothetical protein P8X82_17855 [Gemmatimonadales bacterium]
MKTRNAVWALLCAVVPTVARGQESQGCDYHDPVWSTIFYEGRTGENRDIYAVDLETLVVRRVTTDPANDFRPAPSPDGKWLAFQSNRSGTYQLYRVPIDGGDVEALTAGDFHNAAPKWSPDGREIVFYSVPSEDGGDLYRMDIETRETTRLTTHAALDYAPSWSPDGTAIAFVSLRTGENRIFLTGPEAAAPVLLVDGCGP